LPLIGNPAFSGALPAPYYVAKYSASAAEAWARSKGATEAEIDAARSCLKGMPIRTAQSVQE
jgi:hypothetical protein